MTPFPPATGAAGAVMRIAISAMFGVVLNAQLLTALPRVPLPKAAPGVAHAVVHQDQVSAGRFADKTVQLRIGVR